MGGASKSLWAHCSESGYPKGGQGAGTKTGPTTSATAQIRVTASGAKVTEPDPQAAGPRTPNPPESPPVPAPKSSNKANLYVILFLAICCAFLIGLLLRGGVGEGAVSPESKPIVVESYVTPTPKVEDYANPVPHGPAGTEPATKAAEELAIVRPALSPSNILYLRL